MASSTPQDDPHFYALINYEDAYIQPLLLRALALLPPTSYTLIPSLSSLPSPTSRLLQFVQYESIDWDHLVSHPATSLANAYVIRKALIRKHYLSTTVANWVVKYPGSALKRGVVPSVEFEVDYAEFLDDALVEAWELRESWARNEGVDDAEDGGNTEKEWWILKPGMSDRGQGIRLFSSEEELTAIFEEWDPESSDEEEDDDDDAAITTSRPTSPAPNFSIDGTQDAKPDSADHGIITSQLRHFVAQPYIHPPLLLPPPHSNTAALRKFHIRTYVLAVGALRVFVYKPMLALFAARAYTAPTSANAGDLSAHLTNTCLQESGEREGSVGAFWELPDAVHGEEKMTSKGGGEGNWKDDVFTEICQITGAVFEAAARGMGVHFQPLPNAFEVFGLDFMVGVESDGGLRTCLLEVNAFPDFRQTGEELKGLVAGLFESVVREAVAPYFGIEGLAEATVEGREMVKVLDVDLGRR